MANEATIFTKTTSEGADKMCVLEPGQGIISKMNLGNWDEVRLGLFYSYTNLAEVNADLSSGASQDIKSISFVDPGTLWSFGLKDDNRSALVDENLSTGKFLGIHPHTDYSQLRYGSAFTSGSDRRQFFGFVKSGGERQFPYFAKNGAVNNTAETDGSAQNISDAAAATFGFPGRDNVSGSSSFANIMGLRMRKITGDKVRIWYGRISGGDDFGDITLASLEATLDDFMNQLDGDPETQTPVDIDDPFVTEQDYPDSFYFYGSNVFDDFRWRVGAFLVKKYEIE